MQAVRSLQALYNEDTGSTSSEDEFTLDNDFNDSALASLAGQYLAQGDIQNHHIFSDQPGVVILACSAKPMQPLNKELAGIGASSLFQGGCQLQETLLKGGVLKQIASEGTGTPGFAPAGYTEMYVDIVYVIVSPHVSVHSAGVTCDLCTCPTYSVHAACGHTYLAQSLDLPSRKAFRDCAGELPRRGRKPGIALTAAGKRRAAKTLAKALAKAQI